MDVDQSAAVLRGPANDIEIFR
jgi:hypothetical protein